MRVETNAALAGAAGVVVLDTVAGVDFDVTVVSTQRDAHDDGSVWLRKPNAHVWVNPDLRCRAHDQVACRMIEWIVPGPHGCASGYVVVIA